MFRIPVCPDFELQLCSYSHAVPAYALIEENREYLRKWLPWVDATWSPDHVASWVRRGLEQLHNNDGWHAALSYRGELAGFIGFKPVDWPNLRGEIGYWMGAQFQGKGLMTGAGRVVTQCAFLELGLNRLEIRCATGNQRSAGVARRLGFRQEGVLRQAIRVGEEFQDQLVFGLLREDWDAVVPSGS